MIKPYYIDNDVTLYCGAAEKVLPEIDLNSVGLILTDPPYPDYLTEEYKYFDGIIEPLRNINCKQLIFWSRLAEFPLDNTAIHIWNKNPSNKGAMYERIFERNGDIQCKVFTNYMVNSTVAANMTGDEYLDHPSQKPIKLITRLILEHDEKRKIILDPFAGSGTTLHAAKLLKRRAIGVEISEKYCELIVNRLNKPMPLFDEQKPADLFVATT